MSHHKDMTENLERDLERAIAYIAQIDEELGELKGAERRSLELEKERELSYAEDLKKELEHRKEKSNE